jgi:hypothetical protein
MGTVGARLELQAEPRSVEVQLKEERLASIEMPDSHNFDPAEMTVEGMVEACKYLREMAKTNQAEANRLAASAREQKTKELDMKSSGMSSEEIRNSLFSQARERRRQKRKDNESPRPSNTTGLELNNNTKIFGADKPEPPILDESLSEIIETRVNYIEEIVYLNQQEQAVIAKEQVDAAQRQNVVIQPEIQNEPKPILTKETKEEQSSNNLVDTVEHTEEAEIDLANDNGSLMPDKQDTEIVSPKPEKIEVKTEFEKLVELAEAKESVYTEQTTDTELKTSKFEDLIKQAEITYEDGFELQDEPLEAELGFKETVYESAISDEEFKEEPLEYFEEFLEYLKSHNIDEPLDLENTLANTEQEDTEDVNITDQNNENGIELIVADRIADLNEMQKLAIEPSLRKIVNATQELLELQTLEVVDQKEIEYSKAELQETIQEMFDLLGINYETEEVEKFVEILIKNTQTAKNRVTIDAVDLEHQGTHEAKTKFVQLPKGFSEIEQLIKKMLGKLALSYSYN